MQECKACGLAFQIDDDHEYSCGICGHDFCSSDCFNSDCHDDIDDDVIAREEEDE